MLTAFIVDSKFIKPFLREMEKYEIIFSGKNFFVLEGAISHSIWAKQIWFDCKLVDFKSIKDAASQLKAFSKNEWQIFSESFHRRSSLILENLKMRQRGPINAFADFKSIGLGSFCLLSEKKLVFSCEVWPPAIGGEINFLESKEPPSRAYLKLWELFTFYLQPPKRGEVCLELGSSPGGWTYVLAQLGCKIISVDRADLDLRLNKKYKQQITHYTKDAFSFSIPESIKIDWFFSDIICMPEKALTLIHKWHEKNIENMVCTIKFKGQADEEIINRLLRIPNSQVKHLFHNKNEIIWWNCRTKIVTFNQKLDSLKPSKNS